MLSSPIQDFGAMALLRQYSLLNLPPTWKASLISSYGSFLTQQQHQHQQDFSSPFHRANFLGRAAARGAAAPSQYVDLMFKRHFFSILVTLTYCEKAI